MKITLISLVFILNLFTQVNAIEKKDSANTPIDSITHYPKFEFRKPYIGWEIMGPSNIMALTYQQQFMRLGEKSFLDFQLLINNENTFLEQVVGIYDPENELNPKHGINKFALYLTERNKPLRWLNTEISAGFLYFQEWRFLIIKDGNPIHIISVNTQNNYNSYFILKGSVSAFLARNIGLKLNVNKVFSKDEYNDIPGVLVGNTSFSFSFLLGFNQKYEANTNPCGFIKNQLFFNLTRMQLGYERFLLNRNDYNVSAGIATTAIPFKRFGEYSDKYGWFTLSDAMVNFNYSLNAEMYSFVGVGMFLNYITYYVLSDQYEMQTYGFRSNIGLAHKLNKHMVVKLAYTPYITKDININVENMDHFVFLRQYKLNLLLSYSFGK